MAEENPETLRAALAYMSDAHRNGLYADGLIPYTRHFNLFEALRNAGLNLRGDHHGLFVLQSWLEHLHFSTTNAKYDVEAFTLAIYTHEEFERVAGGGALTAEFSGALIVATARANPRLFRKSHSNELVELPFAKFSPVRIPTSGVWVMAVRDVRNPASEPELVYQTYELTEKQLAVVRARRSIHLQLHTNNPHHAHMMRSSGLPLPLIMLRVSPCVKAANWLTLDAASTQINFSASKYAEFSNAHIGDEETTETAKTAEHQEDSDLAKSIEKVLAKHKTTSAGGYTVRGEKIDTFGKNIGGVQIASASLAHLAITLAMMDVIGRNEDKIKGELQKLNDPSENIFDAREGVAALFAVTAPGGAKSPVLEELRRIFGDIGIPTLSDMLNGGSGLPDCACPGRSKLKAMLDRIIDTKIDTAVETGPMLSEEYMARELENVKEPVWTGVKSPLAIAVLISAMPADFAATASDVLAEKLGMKNAVLRHSRRSDPKAMHGMNEPGIYVQAQMLYFSAAILSLMHPMETLVPISAAKPDQAIAQITAIHKTPTKAAPLDLTLFSVGARFRVRQRAPRETFDAARTHEVVQLQDTLADGSSFALIVHIPSRQGVAVHFSSEKNVRDAVVTDIIDALLEAVTNYRGGEAIVENVSLIASNAEAIRRRVPPAAQLSEEVTKELEAVLRKFIDVELVPVNAASETSSLYVRSINSDEQRTVLFEFVPGGHLGVPLAEVGAEVVSFPHGDKVLDIRMLAVKGNVYVSADALKSLAAAQNLRMGMPLTESQRGFADPYGMYRSTAHIENERVLASGPRQDVGRRMPMLLPRIGASNTPGLVMSHDARTDPSRQYSGWGRTADAWVSPFV